MIGITCLQQEALDKTYEQRLIRELLRVVLETSNTKKQKMYERNDSTKFLKAPDMLCDNLDTQTP